MCWVLPHPLLNFTNRKLCNWYQPLNRENPDLLDSFYMRENTQKKSCFTVQFQSQSEHSNFGLLSAPACFLSSAKTRKS